MIQAWSAYVELHTRNVLDIPNTALDGLHEALHTYSASIGLTPTDNLAIQLTVEAATARQAIDLAVKTTVIAAHEQGISTHLVGIELATEEEQERRLANPVIPALAGLSEVAEILGVSKQRAGQLADTDEFPTAVARLKSGPVFVASQVREFGQRRKGTGRPRKVEDRQAS